MASEGDTYGTITLKGTPITDLRVTDIKRELEKRGLSKSGSKTQLSDRLKAQLLLEKLQQDAAHSSGDEHEGKVPNMALQQNDKAGQSEFVRQYLQQQQRNLEIQMEMKKQVEEERKRKSADESSTDESSSQMEKPDVTSVRKFKDDASNAPAKEGAKMSKPARKSNRNSVRGDNVQEKEQVKNRSESPEPEKLRKHTPSESSSSSRSPSPDKSQSRRGRSSRGRAKRGGGKRGGHQARSRSSSPSSSPEGMNKKKRHRTNSSSHSESGSPQIVSPEVPTRRSNRSSTALKTTPDHMQEKELPQDGRVDKSGDKVENVDESLPSVSKRKWRKRPSSDVAKADSDQRKNEPPKSTPTLHTADSTNERKGVDAHEKLNAEPDNKETESLGPVSKSLKQPVVLEKAPESSNAASKDNTNDAAKRVKMSGDDTVQTSLASSVTPELVSGAVSSTTTSDHAQNVVSENIKENDPSSVRKDNPKEQTSVKADNAKLNSKDLTSAVANASSISLNNEKPSSVEQTSSQVEKEEITKPSPPRNKSRSYSSDSSSGSRSKSPIRRKRSRSSSSSSSDAQSRSRSSSSSSSTDVSGTEDPKLDEKAKAQVKDKRPRSPSHSPDRVVRADREELQSTNKDVPKKSDNLRVDDRTAAPTVTLGVPKSKGQEEKQNQPVKEQEDKIIDTNKKQEVIHGDQEASRDSVTNADADEDTVAKKGIKKRKWGSKTSKAAKTTKRTASMEISSEVLKNLIGDVKLTETVFEMETEVVNTLDYDENEEDRRDVRVKRNVTQVSPSHNVGSPMSESPPREEVKAVQEDARKVETREEYSPEPAEIPAEPEKKIIKLSSAAPKVGGKTKVKEGKKRKEEKKKEVSAAKENKEDAAEKNSKEKVFASTRPNKPLLPVVDEPEPVTGSRSPARSPPNRVIRISRLVRPFTVGQLKELLRRSGELDDEYFWINAIKSHCLAAYKSQEDAVAARAALHGTRWPQSNPKILNVDFATVEEVIHRKTDGDVPLPPLKRPPREDQKKEQKNEDKEKKPKGREQRDKGRVEKEKVERDKREPRDQKRDPEKKNPVREWDRDKIQQLSRSRSKSKERDRVNRRSRSKDRDQRKRRDQSKDKKVDDRRKERKQKDAKADDEPPAKLLDDLFRKTKATPCIYWLPLTEEQVQQRVAKKLELLKEKQKRIAAAEEREKEEMRKRDTARLEKREREKAREKSRERERDKGRQDRSRSSRSYSRSRSRRRR